MKEILVPYDFTEISTNALIYASRMAQEVGGRIVLLHMLDDVSTPAFSAMGEGPQAGIERQRYMIELMKKIKTDFHREIEERDLENFVKGTKVIVSKGRKSMSEHISDQDVDLIVMGTHKDKSLYERFAGTTTEQVIEEAKVPVIAVKPGDVFKPIRKIVFASDFLSIAPETFEYLKLMQKATFAEIVFLYVSTSNNLVPYDAIHKRMTTALKEFDSDNYTLLTFNDKRVSDGIVNAVHSNAADILVMQTKGQLGFNGLIFGNTTAKVIQKLSLPVMAINDIHIGEMADS